MLAADLEKEKNTLEFWRRRRVIGKDPIRLVLGFLIGFCSWRLEGSVFILGFVLGAWKFEKGEWKKKNMLNV